MVRYIFQVVKYFKKTFQHLTILFMSTCCVDSKNMQEIEFSPWLFELPAKKHSQFSPSGDTFLPCLILPSKSYCENSISSIFFESPGQADQKMLSNAGETFCHISPLYKYTVNGSFCHYVIGNSFCTMVFAQVHTSIP